MRVLPVLALLLCGCDPGFTMQGDVVDAAGHPVAGAHAVLVCNGDDLRGTDTDAAGHFRDMRIGVFGQDCAVALRVTGHGPASFPVMENCTDVVRRWFNDDLCAEVTIHATLR